LTIKLENTSLVKVLWYVVKENHKNKKRGRLEKKRSIDFKTNSIYCGDYKGVLAIFLEKFVDLIYADSPFFSNRNYEVIWRGEYELRAFEDRWKEESRIISSGWE
jgi:hypothetical protein